MQNPAAQADLCAGSPRARSIESRVVTRRGAWPPAVRMTTIKTFSNLAEAGFAHSLLEAAGIPAFLADEQTSQLGYGLAVGIRLQVEEADRERAMQVLSKGPDAAATDEKPVELRLGLEPPGEGRRGIPVAVFAAVLLGLGLLMFAIDNVLDRQTAEAAHPSAEYMEADYNRDGRPDRFWTYRGTVPAKAEADHNFDGRLDEWTTCDRLGRSVRTERDTDFNGVADEVTKYKDGVPSWTEVAPNGSPIVTRRLLYTHSILREEWVDENKDGVFDYKIMHDPFGEMSERIPLPR